MKGRCQKIKQLFFIIIMVVVPFYGAMADEDLKPVKDDSFASKVFLKDKAGVMDSMVLQSLEMQRKDEIRENYGLESNPVYRENTQKEDFQFASKNFLKFTEKRIMSGHQETEEEKEEARREKEFAEKNGKSLDKKDESSASKVAKGLIGASKDLKFSDTEFKVKVRPLQGYGNILVKSGTVHGDLNVNYQGDMTLNISKSFNSIGMSVGNEVDIKDQDYEVYVNKNLTAFTVAKLSSKQFEYGNAPLQKESEKRLEVIYSRAF